MSEVAHEVVAGRRLQTPGEEFANSLSHGAGFLVMAAFTPLLVTNALEVGGVASAVGAAVFASTAASTYLISAIYHSLSPGRAKRAFRVLDHGAIFLLIAGTYTPFTVGALRGAWGFELLALIWSLAALGIARELIAGRRRGLSVAIYVSMGWLVLIATKPLSEVMPIEGMLWILAGGVVYTAGVPFYSASSRFRFGHLVWHCFVLAGTACHFVAILRYAA